jgi:hypothetical protein
MESSQTVQWVDVQGVLRGQHTEQVVVSKYIVNIGAVQGGAVNLAPPRRRAAKQSRPRREPPHILPRSAPGFLDRSREQGLVGQALARGEVVDIHGPDGTGKTSLASRAMQAQLPSAYPDGMVYLSARHETREDLLQELFQSFFESDGPVKVTENDVRREMAGKRALIAVDDANLLEEGEAGDLAQVLPQCSLLVTGREQQIWQGEGISLKGLPGRYAVLLFEQHWGDLAAEERPTVEVICEAVGNVPLSIVKIARTAAQQQLTLDQVLQQVRPKKKERGTVAPVLALIASKLSAGQRLLLGGLAAAGGPTVGVEALPVITGLGMDEITRHLVPLREQGLVSANSPRCSLDDGLKPYIKQAWTNGELQAKAAEYYSGKASALRLLPKDPDEENVLSALDYIVQQGQWQQVVTLVRSIDRYLASTGRWGEWRKRLDQALQAARKLGDRASEAWAQNQLGVIAMGAGEVATAKELFRSALSIRRALSDRSGMVVTRWNLHLLTPVPPPPWNRLLNKITSVLRSGGLWLQSALATVALLAVAGFLAASVLAPSSPSSSPPSLPPAATFAPSPTPPQPTVTVAPVAEVSPGVEVWLAEGCGGTYAPGTPLTIQVQASIAGRVAIYQVGTQGEHRVLFEVDAGPQEIISQALLAPEGEGNWVLEANLNHGQATARCEFAVETPVEPQVGIWLAEGCGRQYRPGSATQISLRSNVGGRVAVWLDGRRLFERDLIGGETYSERWNVGSTPGQHRLSAVLEDGGAASECSYSVQAPPKVPAPTVKVWLAEGCGRTFRAGTRTQVSFRASVGGQVAVYLASQGRKTQFLFSQRVQAGRVASRNWTVPELAGSWSLVAVLNGGQARGYCGLAIATTPTPEVEIRLEEGCGHTFPAGEYGAASTVYVKANVDGWVEAYVDYDGTPSGFKKWLTAGEEFGYPWDVPWYAGSYSWEAVLNDGQASDRCAFQVRDTEPVTPTPEVWLETDKGCGEGEYAPGSRVSVSYGASVDGFMTVWLIGQDEPIAAGEVAGGKTYMTSVIAGSQATTYWLTADLRGWEIGASCSFTVPPIVTEPVEAPTVTPSPEVTATREVTTSVKVTPTAVWTQEPLVTPMPEVTPTPAETAPTAVSTSAPAVTTPTPTRTPSPVTPTAVWTATPVPEAPTAAWTPTPVPVTPTAVWTSTPVPSTPPPAATPTAIPSSGESHV